MNPVLHFRISSFLLSVKLLSACLDGDCRTLAFPSFFFFTKKRLANHIIRTEQVPHVQTCELLCYLEPNCVSINFQNKAEVDGKFNCELNNSTHRRHDDDFLDQNGYLYRGSDSACDADPCKYNATCQSGYTHKNYRCICLPGFNGENCERDVNECTDGSHDCDANQDCVNSKGSFSCIPVLSDYTVIVQTANKLGAGTDATVKIKVEGTKGIAERNLEGSFEQGDYETFHFSDWDIEYVKGLEIYRGNEGAFPGWDLEYIIIKVVGATDSIFNYHERVRSGWTTLTLTCLDGHQVNDQQYCSPD